MKMAMAKIQAFIGKDCGCASGTDMIKDVTDLRSKKYDETEYIFSHPATAREVLEGLAESWDDCIPESEALA